MNKRARNTDGSESANNFEWLFNPESAFARPFGYDAGRRPATPPAPSPTKQAPIPAAAPAPVANTPEKVSPTTPAPTRASTPVPAAPDSPTSSTSPRIIGTIQGSNGPISVSDAPLVPIPINQLDGPPPPAPTDTPASPIVSPPAATPSAGSSSGTASRASLPPALPSDVPRRAGVGPDPFVTGALPPTVPATAPAIDTPTTPPATTPPATAADLRGPVSSRLTPPVPESSVTENKSKVIDAIGKGINAGANPMEPAHVDAAKKILADPNTSPADALMLSSMVATDAFNDQVNDTINADSRLSVDEAKKIVAEKWSRGEYGDTIISNAVDRLVNNYASGGMPNISPEEFQRRKTELMRDPSFMGQIMTTLKEMPPEDLLWLGLGVGGMAIAAINAMSGGDAATTLIAGLAGAGAAGWALREPLGEMFGGAGGFAGLGSMFGSGSPATNAVSQMSGSGTSDDTYKSIFDPVSPSEIATTGFKNPSGGIADYGDNLDYERYMVDHGLANTLRAREAKSREAAQVLEALRTSAMA